MDTVKFCCNDILPRWGQYGYQTYNTAEEAEVEAVRTLKNRNASAVEIIRMEQIGSGPDIRFSDTVVKRIEGHDVR